MLTTEQIARICHEANRLYCEDMHHAPILPWGHAPEWQKQSAIEGVKMVFTNPFVTPEEQHENWMRHKLADGWHYGPVKDADKKTHPCLVPYYDLPADQRAKDVLFVNIVLALMPAPKILRKPLTERFADMLDEQERAQSSVDPTAPLPVNPYSRANNAIGSPMQAANTGLLGQSTGVMAGAQRQLDPMTQANASSDNKEGDDGQGHAENRTDTAAEADRNGAKATSGQGTGDAQKGRLTGEQAKIDKTDDAGA